MARRYGKWRSDGAHAQPRLREMPRQETMPPASGDEPVPAPSPSAGAWRVAGARGDEHRSLQRAPPSLRARGVPLLAARLSTAKDVGGGQEQQPSRRSHDEPHAARRSGFCRRRLRQSSDAWWPTYARQAENCAARVRRTSGSKRHGHGRLAPLRLREEGISGLSVRGGTRRRRSRGTVRSAQPGPPRGLLSKSAESRRHRDIHGGR